MKAQVPRRTIAILPERDAAFVRTSQPSLKSAVASVISARLAVIGVAGTAGPKPA